MAPHYNLFRNYLYFCDVKSIREQIHAFKLGLAQVFDDDLHTRRWHNVVDYLIIGMILLSSLEIFMSTFDVDPAFRRVLLWIDIFTLVFFTVEVSLRIWVAPLVDPRFSGWRGRLRYCFTFHGFIDVVSTYPFYLQWLIPFPVGWLKVLRMSRTVRLFRVSRYMKSWRLLTGAIREKRRELIISMQFLVIVTFILSLMLFFCEHEAQPERYDNGLSSIVWAFAQYVTEPESIVDYPPATPLGRTIAFVIGLLGIAIVAVPAGILGAGFTEALGKENRKKQLDDSRAKLCKAFERELDMSTEIYAVPFYRTLPDLQARLHLTHDDMVEVVQYTPGYRLINLASTIPTDKLPHDRLAIEHYALDRCYGQCIDRGSRVTIVSPTAFIEPAVGIFSYYLAEFGGFNYISRELGETAPYRSFLYARYPLESGQQEFYDDLAGLLRRSGAWSFTILASSGTREQEYDTSLHIGIGGARGDGSAAPQGAVVRDEAVFSALARAMSSDLLRDFGLHTDLGRYHDTSQPELWPRSFDEGRRADNVVLRLAWSAMLWNSRRLLLARTIAAAICRAVLGEELPDSADLHRRGFGFTADAGVG